MNFKKPKEKILIVGPSWVGDMVMAQSLFKLLKAINPNCQIDVLAPNYTGALLSRMPEVNAHKISPFGHAKKMQILARRKLGLSLRAENYTKAIILPNSWKSALIPFFANIPVRVGFIGEFRYGLLTDYRFLDKKLLPKMIDRFAYLGLDKNGKLPEKLPWPSLKVETILDIKKLVPDFNSNPRIIAFCPGAEYGSAKRWPIEHFVTLAKDFTNLGFAIWIFGGSKDKTIALEIVSKTENCLDLTGKTSLSEAIDLLNLTSCVVTNDSGLMHIAASLDKPVVALYGSSSHLFTPPLSDKVTILSKNLGCSPCFKRECPLEHTNCLWQLSPNWVKESVLAWVK